MTLPKHLAISVPYSRFGALACAPNHSLPVELVEWTEQPGLRRALANAGVPRVLLVHPEAEPPPTLGVDEGWVWMDATDAEVEQCARDVLDRLAASERVELVDERVWSYSGRTFRLTRLQARLFAELAAHRGTTVTHERLMAVGWPGEPVNHGVARQRDAAAARTTRRHRAARSIDALRRLRPRVGVRATGPDRRSGSSRHGGTISVHERGGRGTKVTTVAASRRPATILLVEDDPAQRQALSTSSAPVATASPRPAPPPTHSTSSMPNRPTSR